MYRCNGTVALTIAVPEEVRYSSGNIDTWERVGRIQKIDKYAQVAIMKHSLSEVIESFASGNPS